MSTDGEAGPETKEVLAFFQIIAIVAAGIWTLYVFNSYEKTGKTLESELRKLRIRNERSQLASRIDVDPEIRVTCLSKPRQDERNEYAVSCSFEIENLGTTPTEVTWVLLDAYIATRPSINVQEVALINGFEEDGVVEWRSAASRGHYYRKSWSKKRGDSLRRGNRKIPLAKGGGGTAELEAGETSGGSIEFMVSARPSDMVGFYVGVGLDGGEDDDERPHASRWTFFETPFSETGPGELQNRHAE